MTLSLEKHLNSTANGLQSFRQDGYSVNTVFLWILPFTVVVQAIMYEIYIRNFLSPCKQEIAVYTLVSSSVICLENTKGDLIMTAQRRHFLE